MHHGNVFSELTLCSALICNWSMFGGEGEVNGISIAAQTNNFFAKPDAGILICF